MMHFTLPIGLVVFLGMALATFLYAGFGLLLLGRNSPASATKIYAFALPVLAFVVTGALCFGAKTPSRGDEMALIVAMGCLFGGAAFYSKTEHDRNLSL